MFPPQELESLFLYITGFTFLWIVVSQSRLNNTNNNNSDYQREGSIKELCQLSLFLWMLFFIGLLLHKIVSKEYYLFVSMFAWILTSFIVYSPSPNLLVRFKIARTLNSIYSLKGPTKVIDCLVGDVLCSYSFLWREIDYLFFNLRRPFLPAQVEYKESILCPFLSFIPSMIRIKQCLIDYSISADKEIFINIAKYSLGLPILYFLFKWDSMFITGKIGLILLMELSTIFNIYWDVFMDWRADSPEKMEKIKWTIFLNAMARHSWIVLLAYDLRIFYIQFIEIIRRFIWLHYRLPFCKSNSRVINTNNTTSSTTTPRQEMELINLKINI